MNNKITCFLPCREGSQRIPHKNIKSFAGYKKGLVEIKLNQLLHCKSIDMVVLSTNDDSIIEYANSLTSDKLQIHRRTDALASNSTSTDSLVQHARSLVDEGHILWTHVTSPFVSAKFYDDIIKNYFASLEKGYDSLMTVTPFRGFMWDKNTPINYDRSKEKWPRTQTIKPLYEVNSAAFIASTNIYDELQDRIGATPFFYELDKTISHDIDWPEDFLLAEHIAEKGFAKI
jgi:CMP-N-acetylneuraminic acid synthetase